MKQKRRGSHSYRVLSAFLRDASNCDVIAGKREYLPLMRRIARGRAYWDNCQLSEHDTLQHIQNAIKHRLDELESYGIFLSDQHLDGLGRELEDFIDRPEWSEPPTVTRIQELKANSSHRDQVRVLSFELLYLLSLLPSRARESYQSFPFEYSVSEHFALITKAYNDSKLMLLEGTLRYVIRLARYYVRSGEPYMDLVQEGFLGLMSAIERFNEQQGSHFQSYAAIWIKQRITRYISNNSRPIRIPVHQEENVHDIDRVVDELHESYGRSPTQLEVFLTLGWLTENDIQLLEHRSQLQNSQELDAKFEKYRARLSKYANKSLCDVPVKQKRMVSKLQEEMSALNEDGTSLASALRILVKMRWLSQEEAELIQKYRSIDLDKENVDKALNKLKNSKQNYVYCQMATARYFSLENTQTRLSEMDTAKPLIELLATGNDTERIDRDCLLRDAVTKLLESLSERERDVIESRFGLHDGTEYTLQEIGERLGFSRERARQLQDKALRKLVQASRRLLIEPVLEQHDSLPELILHKINRGLLSVEDYYTIQDSLQCEEEIIVKFMEKHLTHGLKRIRSRKSGPRALMYRRVLESAGQPLHYSAIHEQVLANLSQGMHFSKERTYATLFYSDQFRFLGNGVFAVADWDADDTNVLGEKVLIHCPVPLLPEGANARAFFESIFVGRELLNHSPSISVDQFYAEMLAWAGRSDPKVVDIQNSFEAWYAVGLCEYVDFSSRIRHPVRLTIDPHAKLEQVRTHCLDSLCQRVSKMPELILVMTRVARPTIADLQKALFGSDRSGFDVSTRLKLLVSFEAVHQVDDEWRLTQIGESLLVKHPPQEIPDFSMVEEVALDDERIDELDNLDWEEALGLLEI